MNDVFNYLCAKRLSRYLHCHLQLVVHYTAGNSVGGCREAAGHVEPEHCQSSCLPEQLSCSEAVRGRERVGCQVWSAQGMERNSCQPSQKWVSRTYGRGRINYDGKLWHNDCLAEKPRYFRGLVNSVIRTRNEALELTVYATQVSGSSRSPSIQLPTKICLRWIAATSKFVNPDIQITGGVQG